MGACVHVQNIAELNLWAVLTLVRAITASLHRALIRTRNSGRRMSDRR
jgi:hypothetical protein